MVTTLPFDHAMTPFREMASVRHPIRVLLVISNLEYGGSQRQIVELANHIDHSRFEVHVCSLSKYVPLAVFLADADKRLHIIKKRFKYDASVISRLVHLINRLDIDIVHSYLFDADIAASIAARIAGVSACINSERNTDYVLKKRQLLAYRLIRGCVDLTIANSNAGAVFNSKMLGRPISKYRVVHNGVDSDRFTPREGFEIRRELGIEDGEYVVGMFASFKQQKNHPLFFRAARRILHRFPKTRFLLVGDMLHGGLHGSAEYMQQVDQLVDKLQIRDRCLFLGNRTDVENLYRACDVTILPSLFEGTPNVLLESMACGVPVIATDVSDNSYIVPDGQAGYIVPLNDEEVLSSKVCNLLCDEKMRKMMSRSARDCVVKGYSCRALSQKTEDIYRELLFGINPNTRPLKVAIVTSFPEKLDAPKGGVESVSVYLTRALAKMKDLEIHIITMDAGRSSPSVSKCMEVTVHRLPHFGRRILSRIMLSDRWQIQKYLRDLSPDIVHSHDYYGIMVKGIQIPRVFTIHGFIHRDTLVSGGKFASIRSKIWRIMETSGWANHLHIISISPYVRKELTGIAKGAIYDIENPIDESFFTIERRERRGVIFSAAEISPRKNTAALVDALAILVTGGTDAELRLAGAVADQQYGQLLQERIRMHHLEERVVILGGINSDQVRVELAGACVFALVSLEENSPMGIAEAMAAGISVVTSRRCGMPYMVREGETGYLVEPDDVEEIAERLRTLLEREDLRASMGEKARRIAQENYNPRIVAQRTKEVYYIACNRQIPEVSN